MTESTKQYTLTGTGLEISNFAISDTYKYYQVTGTAVATGNYAISVSGTPTINDSFILQWRGVLDITTGSHTFSILGTSVTANQLLYDFDAICTYNGSSWDVLIDRNFTGVVNETINYKNNSVTNSILNQMATMTVKANVTGATADPQDVSISTFFGNNAWKTTGNSGLTAGTNFIGTTDAVDLVFKVANIEAGRINIALTNLSLGLSNLISVTTGNSNTAIGHSSLASLTTGSTNTAIGGQVLNGLTTGNSNTSVGYSSGGITSGSNNTVVGYGAANVLTTGIANTIIGYNANIDSPSGYNRIALGAGAIADEDFQFALPDDVTKFRWRGTSYTLPSSDGTAGQSLKTNGAGVLYWG